MTGGLLNLLIALPFIGGVFCLVNQFKHAAITRVVALSIVVIEVILAIVLLFQYNDLAQGKLYFETKFSWFKEPNIVFYLGADSFSLIFIVLTCVVIGLLLLYNLFVSRDRVEDYCMALLLLEGGALCVFSSFDLILFYTAYSFTVIVLFFMLNLSKHEDAPTRFFLYVGSGALISVIGIVYILLKTGTTSMPELTALLHKMKPESQRYLWWLLTVPFLINLGMVPFHNWLVRAHAISEVAILSSFMLVGLHGLFKIPLALLPKASKFFSPAIFVICNVSIIYLLMAALRKRELKAAILYAAVANISYAVLGLFSFTAEGLYGFMLQAASHCFIFFLLLVLIGFLSKHAHFTNEGYAGLSKRAPRFALIFSFAFLALLSPFMGKVLGLIGLYKASKLQCFIAGLGLVLMVTCLLPLYIKGLFAKPIGAHQSNDITTYETAISLVLIVFIVVLGLYPDLIGNFTKESSAIFFNSIKAYE